MSLLVAIVALVRALVATGLMWLAVGIFGLGIVVRIMAQWFDPRSDGDGHDV